jgi:hypothetical protein
MSTVKNEPVLTGVVLTIVLGFLLRLGFNVTGEALNNVINAVVLIVGIVARSRVTPTNKL